MEKFACNINWKMYNTLFLLIIFSFYRRYFSILEPSSGNTWKYSRDNIVSVQLANINQIYKTFRCNALLICFSSSYKLFVVIIDLRARFKVKSVFSRMDFRYKDKTVPRKFNLYNRNSYTDKTTFLYWDDEGCFNIKMIFYQDMKSHCRNKTIVRPSYLHKWISYTGKTTSLYWDGAPENMSMYWAKLKVPWNRFVPAIYIKFDFYTRQIVRSYIFVT